MKDSHIKLLILISLLCILVYFNALECGFTWDDYGLITQNHLISNFKSNIKDIFSQNLYYASFKQSSFYRPLQTLTFVFDYSIWGFEPFGYHLTNILLHLVNSLLLYLLAFLLTKNKFVSFITLILYAVHPIHTEAVTYVAGRADSLVSIFILASLILFIKFLDRKSTDWFLYLASISSFIFGLLSKEIAIFLPLVVLFFAINKRKVLLALPFFVLSATYLLLRIGNAGVNTPCFSGDLLSRTATFVSLLPSYLRILIFPVNLHMSYTTKPYANIFYPLVILILICLWLVYSFKKNKLIFYGSIWFIFWLIPQSNIYPINAYFAEHFLYISSMGFFFIVAVGLNDIKNLRLKKIAVFIVCLLMIFYSAVTIRQNSFWRDPLKLFSRITELSPRSFSGFNNLGLTYEDGGQFDLARKCYEKALVLKPDMYEARVNLARLYCKLGKIKEGKDALLQAIKLDPCNPQAYSHLAFVYLDEGNTEKAADFFNRAILLRQPGTVFYHNELGLIYRQQGKFDEAIKEFEKAILGSPHNAPFFNNMGTTYRLMGEYDAAIKAYEQALMINPGPQAAYHNLAVVYAVTGDKRAEGYFKKSIELDPRDVNSYFNLGIYYLENGNPSLAKSNFKKALSLSPDHEMAREYLGRLN